MIAPWLLGGCALDSGPGSPTESDTGEVSAFEVVLDRVPGGTLLAAWSDGDRLVIVGGDLGQDGGTTGSIVTWTDGAWCVEEAIVDRTLWWIHGPRAGEWYAVGGAGVVLHEVDGVRVREDLPTVATLYGVWAAEDGRVWAVGGDVFGTELGEIWVRKDGAWSLHAADLPGVLFKVWDRWIVGAGVSYHLEGDMWVEQPLPAGERLLTARGRADDDVWAVGGSSNPTLLHWDGTAWTDVDVDPHCTGQPLNGIWTAPGEDVWIAGNSGAMGRYDGAEWECAFPPITGESFHAVWQHEDEHFWAGGNLLSSGADHYGTVGHYGALGTATAPTCVEDAR